VCVAHTHTVCVTSTRMKESWSVYATMTPSYACRDSVTCVTKLTSISEQHSGALQQRLAKILHKTSSLCKVCRLLQTLTSPLLCAKFDSAYSLCKDFALCKSLSHVPRVTESWHTYEGVMSLTKTLLCANRCRVPHKDLALQGTSW